MRFCSRTVTNVLFFLVQMFSYGIWLLRLSLEYSLLSLPWFITVSAQSESLLPTHCLPCWQALSLFTILFLPACILLIKRYVCRSLKRFEQRNSVTYFEPVHRCWMEFKIFVALWDNPSSPLLTSVASTQHNRIRRKWALCSNLYLVVPILVFCGTSDQSRIVIL